MNYYKEYNYKFETKITTNITVKDSTSNKEIIIEKNNY